MAKKKQVKLKLPKQVAGVKVPKNLRKTVETASGWLDHPVVADVVAAALMAAAASLSQTKPARKAANAVGDEAGDAAAGTVKVVHRAGDAIAAAAKEAGRELLAAYSDGGKAAKAKAGKKRNSGKRAAKPGVAH